MKTKRKRLWMTAVVTSLLLAVFVGGCKKDDYVEVVGVCPVVESTNPLNTATVVPVNQVISATFNEKMNPATITQSSFSLQGSTKSNVLVPGTVSYDESTATMSFVPTSPLLSNTTYTAIVIANVKDLKGNALQADYIWTFTTGLVLSPTVVSVDPAHLATNVVLNKIVSANFSMPMNELTINDTTFVIRKGLTLVHGVVAYSGTTATFTSAVPLTANTVYSGTITKNAKNVAGIPLENDYNWTFTTGSLSAPVVVLTDPANNATGVVLNKLITATFSEIMNPLTFTATTFMLKQGTTAIPGIISYYGKTVSFLPSSHLLANTAYTMIITTGAENETGVALADNYRWTFTTGLVTAPTVISTVPLNNTIGVALNQLVTATFSEPMDPLTLVGTSFLVKQGTTIVAGSVTNTASTISFKPDVAFSPNTIYTGNITTEVKNVNGIPMAYSYSWTFTTLSLVAPTVILTDPLNNATGVVLGKTIVATFSTPMDPLTLTTTTFLLKQGVTTVNGAVSYAGSIASFNPDVDLLPNTSYTATITTGVKMPDGTSLATDFVWSFTTSATATQSVVDLGTVERFGIISGVGVSNNAGFSEIRNMDVGIYPGLRSSITGFPPAIIVNGAIYAADDILPPGIAAMLNQAKLDLTAAYLFAEGAITPAPVTVSGDQGGKTLAPGIYKSTSTLLIQSGDLTLDAQGNPDAVWIFQVASGFTTIGGAGGNVILSGGAQAKNIFWQVGTSAVIGDYTIFKGNVLALTSITMNSHATAEGRMLAINGAVVMTHTNIISKP